MNTVGITDQTISLQRDESGGWTYLVSWVIALLVAAVLVAIPIRDFIVYISIGDGLAYARVAFNVANGYGSTYDGVTVTNGYHPLWMWLHVPMFLGADSVMSRMGFVRILWVGTALTAIGAWAVLIYRVTASRLAAATMVVVMGSFGWTVYVLYAGVETPLVLLLLGVTFLRADRLCSVDRIGFMQCAVLGALMALTFLARLDSAFVLAPLGLWMFVRACRASIGCALVMAISAIAIPLPYLAWNVSRFGDVMPVSGRVKWIEGIDLNRTREAFGHWVERRADLLPSVLVILFALVFILGLAIASWTVWRLLKNHRRAIHVLWLLPVGAVAHYVYYLLKVQEVHVPWHLYPQAITVYVLAAMFVRCLCQTGDRNQAAAESMPMRSVVTYIAIVVMVLSSTAVYATAKMVRRPRVARCLDVAEWISRNVPTGTRIAMYDSFTTSLGLEGYHLIDLNGLVGDATSAEMARDKRHADMVRRHGCELVVSWLDGDCDAPSAGAVLFETYRVRNGQRLAVLDAEACCRVWDRDGPNRFPCP